MAQCTMLFCRIELTLHHVELAIDFRQAAFWFDQDHAVHAIGNVLGNHGGCAVIHEQPRVHGREDRKSHTSELQSLMRISYAVFCLKKKKKDNLTHYT